MTPQESLPACSFVFADGSDFPVHLCVRQGCRRLSHLPYAPLPVMVQVPHPPALCSCLLEWQVPKPHAWAPAPHGSFGSGVQQASSDRIATQMLCCGAVTGSCAGCPWAWQSLKYLSTVKLSTYEACIASCSHEHCHLRVGCKQVSKLHSSQGSCATSKCMFHT